MRDQLGKHRTLRIHLLCSNTFLEAADISALKELKKESAGRFVYLITEALTQSENHVKCVIVDNYFFDVGGTGIQDNLLANETKTPKNIYTTFLPTSFSDLDVIGSGELAKGLRAKFFDLFQRHEEIVRAEKWHSRFFELSGEIKPSCQKFEHSPELIKNAKARFLFCHPNEENQISKMITKRFRSANQSIHIAHMAFIPQEEIKNSLLQRKKLLRSN